MSSREVWQSRKRGRVGKEAKGGNGMEMDELVVAHSRDESGTSRKFGPGNSVTRCGCHQFFKPGCH